MIRNTVFICSIGFLAAWTLLSIWGMIEALGGFTDTYASIVAATPALGNRGSTAISAARRHTLECGRMDVVAVPPACSRCGLNGDNRDEKRRESVKASGPLPPDTEAPFPCVAGPALIGGIRRIECEVKQVCKAYCRVAWAEAWMPDLRCRDVRSVVETQTSLRPR